MSTKFTKSYQNLPKFHKIRQNFTKFTKIFKFNQIHNVKNIFVTDGSCMTSSATQNPSLTYMALTARAANYAVSEIKKKNL